MSDRLKNRTFWSSHIQKFRNWKLSLDPRGTRLALWTCVFDKHTLGEKRARASPVVCKSFTEYRGVNSRIEDFGYISAYAPAIALTLSFFKTLHPLGRLIQRSVC